MTILTRMKKEFFEIKTTTQLCKKLGIPKNEAEKIIMKRNLVIAITDCIEKKKWTHAIAASKAKVGRTVITAILNGNLQKISMDRLIDISQNLGLHVTLKVA